MQINLLNLMDESKCYELLRDIRWSDGVCCPHCSTNSVIKNGHDENQLNKQRYQCKSCEKNFDDLTGTIFSNSNLTLKVWILVLYLMGLNLSNKQISKELEISEPTAQRMTTVLREGIVKKSLIYNLNKKLRQTRFI